MMGFHWSKYGEKIMTYLEIAGSFELMVLKKLSECLKYEKSLLHGSRWPYKTKTLHALCVEILLGVSI
jgi:hypothetical protein